MLWSSWTHDAKQRIVEVVLFVAWACLLSEKGVLWEIITVGGLMVSVRVNESMNGPG